MAYNIAFLYYNQNGDAYPATPDCNDKKCNWIGDTCGCKWIILPEDYWMSLPNPPKELSLRIVLKKD